MNYSELQQIIRYIRKSLPCSQCKKAYTNDNIEVLSTFDDQALFHLNCSHCTNQIIVHVTISDQETTLTSKETDTQQIIQAKKAMNERAHRSIGKADITLNDVIDIHQFLNTFNGDFKSLFHK